MQDTITLADGTIVQVADFEFGFTLNSKAIVTSNEDADGPLTIEGYASDFGLDRQEEAFEPGAFDAGLKAYIEQNPVLLYHHKMDTALGTVKEARLDAKGLWVRAEVDTPEPNTAVADYYRKIKNGVIKGFSVGGKFYRRMTAAGPRIFKCDLREISVTPMPVNQRMLFAVAGKAFETMDTATTPDLSQFEDALTRIDEAFARLEGKASQHPDGPKVAALQYHLQRIHTLATDIKQDQATENGTKNIAEGVANDVAKHLKKVHSHATKIGPLPNHGVDSYYGSSNL